MFRKIPANALTVLLLTGVLFLDNYGSWGPSFSAAAEPNSLFDISLENNHLSAKIEARPLGEVLQKLTRLTKIEINLDRLIENEPVSVDFNRLSLEEGIQRILQGYNYALTYAQPSHSSHRASPKVVEIRVFPKATGPLQDPQITDSEISYSISTKTEAPPESRGSLFEKATAHRDSDPASALQSEDPKVRESALESFGEGDQPVPIDTLTEMALTDKNPQLRMDAMSLLAEKGGDASVETLRKAALDPDPGVSGLAKGLLEVRKVSAEVLLETLKEDSR